MGQRGPSKKINVFTEPINLSEKLKIPKSLSQKAQFDHEDQEIAAKHARNLLKELIPILQARGSLAEGDNPTLELLCHCYGIYQLALQRLSEQGYTIQTVNRNGGTYVQQSPWINIMKIANDQYIRYCAKFGLSPSDRKQEIDPKAGDISDFERLQAFGRHLGNRSKYDECEVYSLIEEKFGARTVVHFPSREDFEQYLEDIGIWPQRK